MATIYFTPGPAHLYPTVPNHITEAIKAQIPSISHRSQTFMDIHKLAVDGLQALLTIPSDYSIFFLSSATEIWERLLQNCVQHTSFHYVNGAFSQRYFTIANDLGVSPVKYEVPWGQGFPLDPNEIQAETEMINFTHNETSTGVMLPMQSLAAYRQAHPAKLITLDMVSSAPYGQPDWKVVDAAYFSVQKCFGLPAGLGVLILNDSCLAKAAEKKATGRSIGSYHSFLAQQEKYVKHQTVETPNMMGIYLLGKVVQDMLEIGVDNIRKTIRERATLLYSLIEKHPLLTVSVTDKKFQSPTVIVPNLKEGAPSLVDKWKQQGVVVGNGYGKMKGKQLRFANFPSNTDAEFERLIALLEEDM
ncbi:MAG: aminotransferase class V-fold PLP-dependent enzyme [Bacteroidota bacterium]